jgi:hypothetical protein
MFRSLPYPLAILAACGITTGIAMAQQRPSPDNSRISTGPVAYVYVSGTPAGTKGGIYGFAAAKNGKLTPVPGSPFRAPTGSLALNGRWLFQNGDQKEAIYTYSIGSDGSIRAADTFTKFQVPAYQAPVTYPFLDHTGASLYVGFADNFGDNGFESFDINQKNGKIAPLSALYTGVGQYYALTFMHNNQFAYGASCYHFAPVIYGVERRSDGSLVSLGMDTPIPNLPVNHAYCPLGGVAADPYNDLVAALYEYPFVNGPGRPEKFQLAVYTADKYGNLSTTSTYANMRTTQVEPDYLAMSPRGVYLAATGAIGLQVFYMHGSKPLTALSGVILPGVPTGNAFWDDNQHLYVITATNKLYVFSVGTSGVKQAPGSPYNIPVPSGLIVLPKQPLVIDSESAEDLPD